MADTVPNPPSSSSSYSSSSSTTTTTLPPAENLAPYRISLLLVAACPVLIAIPPRKLDLFTFTLGTTFLISLNQVVTTRSGRNIYEHLPRFDGLPTDKAREVKRQLRRGEKGGIDERGVLEKVWMGDETKGWRERRMREEQKRLESGEGYWDLIMDQIKEVWRGEAKKVEELKEVSERVEESKK
jgi:hypothetical protein